jgi:cytochrome c-type biogenesis protein CcmH
MTSFIIAAGLLTLVVLAIPLYFVLRRRASVSDNRKALNAAVYRDQLAELERERSEGSLEEADFNQARDELERRILEDTATPAEVTDTTHGRRAALAMIVAIPVIAVAMYAWRGNIEVFNPQQPPQVTEDKVREMVDTLAAKLAKNPDNPQGWAMLARSYMTLERPADAVEAFSHIEKQMENDPQLMADYAEALVASGKDEGFAKAGLWASRALALEPGNAKALYLSGGIAFAAKDYRKALANWEKLMPLVEPGSEDAKFVLSSINQARAMLKQPPLTAEQFQRPEGPVNPRQAPSAASSVSGRLDIDAGLKAKASPGDTVFLFARAVDGPRMPLAVVKSTVGQLPLDFELTDGMAMSPQFRISSFAQVRIEARVSKSGSATPASGDLIGASLPVKPGARGVQVTINQVQP